MVPRRFALWLLSLFSILGLGYIQECCAETSDVCNNDGSEATATTEGIDMDTIIQDISSSLAKTSDLETDNMCVPRSVQDVQSAVHDFSPSSEEKGVLAWKFLQGLANSPTFVRKYWQRKPLLIRATNSGGWVEESFTVENDLKLVDNSYITGHKTAEILRNGTKTDTWQLSPLKDDPLRKTTWRDVSDALDGGTIYFNTAGSLWPNLGGLCRLTGYAFGLPPNVNVYVTPPGLKLSVPPHTDKQDVFVFQTQGAKRWRVFAPPERVKGKDPLSRGKTGDVLTMDEMNNGTPIIDTILQKGDVLYVPLGFPHTTDTSTLVDGADTSVFHEPSVHLTMGLDTHVWCLSIAHMRWSLLQRCEKDVNLHTENDDAYWKAMESIPVGFLGGKEWKESIRTMEQKEGLTETFKTMLANKLTQSLIDLEPNRWKVEGTNDRDDDPDRESLPGKNDIDEVSDYFVTKHWVNLMDTQEMLFKDVDPASEETLVKAFRGTQDQNLVMEKFGEFSNNEPFAKAYAQRRIAAEQRTKGLI